MAVRRVLLLTFAFPPDNTASAARPGQFYDYLPEQGLQPFVIASTNFGAVEGNERVQRVPVANPALAVAALSVLGRLFARYCAPYEDRLGWVPHAAAAAVRALRAQRFDAVISTSPSLTAHVAALWIKARFGLPWIADFQDPIQDNPFRTRRWIYPYDAILERTIFRRADRLIANTDTVGEAWAKRYPRWADKIAVVWNSFDPKEVLVSRPVERSYKLLAHVGSLYGGRHPAQLLRSFERLRIESTSARVKLVGPIDEAILAEQGPLLRRTQAKGLLEFENRLVPQEEAIRETAEADYLILLDLNELNASFQVPSKLLSYIRVGKPILAYTPRHSPVERILAKSGIAHVAIDPRASDMECDQKLMAFLQMPSAAHRPSQWFEETFDARTQARVIASLLDDLMPNKLSPSDVTGVSVRSEKRRVAK